MDRGRGSAGYAVETGTQPRPISRYLGSGGLVAARREPSWKTSRPRALWRSGRRPSGQPQPGNGGERLRPL